MRQGVLRKWLPFFVRNLGVQLLLILLLPVVLHLTVLRAITPQTPLGSSHDSTPPTVTFAEYLALDTVRLTFNEQLDLVQAQNASHYGFVSLADARFSDPQFPTTATLGASGLQVTLNLPMALLGGAGYLIQLSGIEDVSGNAVAAGEEASIVIDPTSYGVTVDATQPVNPLSDGIRGVQMSTWMHAAGRKPGPNEVANLPELTAALQPGVLRFAGGLWANAVGWDRSSTIQEWGASIPFRWTDPNTSIEFDYNYTHVYNASMMDSLGAFSAATGADVMMQINICDNNPAMWVDLLTYTNVENTYAFKYWELGNELSLDGYWTCMGTANEADAAVEYANRFLVYRAALLAVDPTIKVMGPVAHQHFENPTWVPPLLAATDTSGDDLDVVSWHRYPMWDPISFPWIDDKLFDIADRKAMVETIMTSVQGMIDDAGTQNTLTAVTELNTHVADKVPTNGNHIGALWMMDVLPRFAYNGLDINIWYDLYDVDFFELITGIGDDPASLSVRPTYYGMLMLSQYTGDTLVQSATSDPDERVVVWATTDSTDPDKLKLIAVNLTGVPATVDIDVTGFTPQSGVFYTLANPHPKDLSDESVEGGTTINGQTIDTSAGNVQSSIDAIPGQAVVGISGNTVTHTLAPYSGTAIILSATPSGATDTTPPSLSIVAPFGSAPVSGTLTIDATASDDVGVSRVDFMVDGVIQATDIAPPYSFDWNTFKVSNATHFVSAQAYDAAGNHTTTVTTQSVFNAVAIPMRVDVGGNVITDGSGNVWQADQPYAAESHWGYVNDAGVMDTTYIPQDIVGTAEDTLFSLERYGMDRYQFDLANGTYDVRLLFAETAIAVTAAGLRTFDVAAEGVTHFSSLDVYAEAGFATALIKDLPNIQVTDGRLDIVFTDVVLNPALKGIEILADNTLPEPTPTPTPDPLWTATPTPPATSTPLPTATSTPGPGPTTTPVPLLPPSPPFLDGDVSVIIPVADEIQLAASVEVSAGDAVNWSVVDYGDRDQFGETFPWKGNHGATIKDGTATTVWWDEDVWDASGDTVSNAIDSKGKGNHIDIHRSVADVSDAAQDNLYVVGGNGDPGVGVMHVDYEGIMSARLRNPLLITPAQPGVVEFRASSFVTTAHWWEIAITPASSVVSGEFTAVPSPGEPFAGNPGSGHSPPEDSINFILLGESDVPCQIGWSYRIGATKSLGHTGRVQYLGPTFDTDPSLVEKLYQWRLEYFPDRIVAFADLDEDGVLEHMATLAVQIPWSEVFVQLLGVSYHADTHPQGACHQGLVREITWKDVRVGPTKYGRTATYPKSDGAQRVPQETGWMSYDIRDTQRFGTVNEIAQPNAAKYNRHSSMAFCSDTSVFGCFVETPSKTLTFELPAEDATGAVHARFVYEMRRNGAATLTLNGTLVGDMPAATTVPGASAEQWVRRSLDVNPSLFVAGTNTITIDMTGNVQMDRLEFEFSYPYESVGSVSSSGVYTVPTEAYEGTVRVRATNTVDPTKFADLLLYVDNAASLAPVFSHEQTYGTSGSGDLQNPWGVAVNSAGNIFVTDRSGHQVKKYDPQGNFIKNIGWYGTRNGRFIHPTGIAVDENDNIYVVDSGNHRIQKFDASGGFIMTFGTWGSGLGQFNAPFGIAVQERAGVDYVFVADRWNHRVQKFDEDGNFLTTWGSSGSGTGNFHDPLGVAVDADGNVYVADTDNDRIQKFTNDGTPLAVWGTKGSAAGQLSSPYGITIDENGNVLVVDSENSRVQMFDNSGAVITTWSGFGSGDGQVNTPTGLALDASNRILVVDWLNGRIVIYDDE